MIAAVLAALVGQGNAPQEVPLDATPVDHVLESSTPGLDVDVALGMAWLAAQQVEDGSFGQGRYAQHVGIASLAAMAFMSDGSLPGRGPWGEIVDKALTFVLDSAQESGLIAAETSHGPMYGHGFATLFLAEIYGMTSRDPEVREVLARAVDLIVRTQNPEGGWRYQPVPADADVSVTICQVMAMRAARNAGIAVPSETIDRAVAYVRRCQNEDGGFRYMSREGPAAWPRTAAGVATLYYAGIYQDDAITRGLDWLLEHGRGGVLGASQAHYFYGHYYAVQAMYLAGGERWQSWWASARDELLQRQGPDGGWTDHHIGGSYSTAMALIVLQIPNRCLPIIQR